MRTQVGAGLSEKFLGLFFPRRCVQCSREGQWACPACRAGAALSLESLDGGQTLSLFVFAEGGLVRELLHNLKYNSIQEIATEVRSLTEEKLASFGFGSEASKLKRRLGVGDRPAVLIPVPCRGQIKKSRGYNQAEELAQVFGAWLKWPVWPQALQRQKRATQVGKGMAAREAQATAAYAWSGQATPEFAQGKIWVIFDDIYTTGSTLAACRAALAEHTVNEIKGLVMAHKIGK